MDATIAALGSALADRYTIDREIGAGGMATVYLAADLRHDRPVALKVLRPELSAVIGAERFLAEIKTTANLQHPHILPLFDSGAADGFLFYVMPYVEGVSLRDRLAREKQLPVAEAVRIATEVLSALDYAHRHGVIHRDIKPENILLHDGRALVADFGIALAVSTAGAGRMTETGMSLGTPHYMSPEQAMGEREISAKSDVYAVGCVLYEMLAGEPPFTGPSAQAIIARVVTEEPRSLTVQRKTIPPHVEAAVRTALQKLPADRYLSAAQFAEALAKTDYVPAVSQTASAAVPAVAAEVAAPMRRSRQLVTLIPWGLLAAGVAAAAVLWPRAVAQPVTRERIVLWGKRSMPAGRISRDVAISPDGATIVFVDTVGGAPQLFAKERDRLDATALAGTAGVQGGVTFSPDGASIAFVADGKVKKVPRLGGSAITVADSAQTGIPSVAWLDGGTILFNTVAFDLKAVGEDGGPQRRLWRSDTTQRGAVNVTGLPGGNGALLGVCTLGGGCALWALDVRSGASHVLSDEVLKGWYLPGGAVVFARRDGGVFAAPFDVGKLAFSSAPVPVLEGVRTGGATADMAVSADGTLIYAVGSGQVTGRPSEAVIVTRDGAITPIDSGWTFPAVPIGGLAISPDGRRLALPILGAGHADIWIKALGDRGAPTRLTFEKDNGRPVWTADGGTVLYVSGDGLLLANAELRARRADGTGAVQTLFASKRGLVDVTVTRDTMQFVLRVTAPPSRDIVGWRRGDSAVTPLVADAAFDEVTPAVSPDGRWLAYQSNESGRNEVFVRPYPNVSAGRWQVSRDGGTEPTWAHSGREMFYRNGAGALVAATVGPGPTFALGEQKVLFAASSFRSELLVRAFGVMPDDRRFVFIRDVGQQAAATLDLVQVTNWLSEVRTRLKAKGAK